MSMRWSEARGRILRTTSICALVAATSLQSLANSRSDNRTAKQDASEALKVAPFDLVCTFLSGPVLPESNGRMDDSTRYTIYALLRERPSFELNSTDGKMVLTPTDRASMHYVLRIAQPSEFPGMVDVKRSRG